MMSDRDALEAQLRQEFQRQAPGFDLGESLPNTVRVLVHRRRQRRLAVSLVAVAVVAAAIAVPLASLRSSPVPRSITPATQPTTGPAASAPLCVPNQLVGTVVFNATQSELGSIKLSNSASEPCSLSGRPRVTLLGDNGIPLLQTEMTYHRAPDWPPPSNSIVLSGSGALPQAIVELDWIWCGTIPHELEVQVQFSTWSSPLDVPSTSISPSGFSPATCSSTGASAVFAVDYVRGFGRNGIIGPTSSTSSTTTPVSTTHVILGPDGLGVVGIGAAQGAAVLTMTHYLGSPTTTSFGVCKDTAEVQWSDLSLEFTSGKLTGYRYLPGGLPAIGKSKRPNRTFGQPHLTASTGATLGMTLRQVRGFYPPNDFSYEQGGAITVQGTTTGDRLFLGFFGSDPSTALAEIKGGSPCGDF